MVNTQIRFCAALMIFVACVSTACAEATSFEKDVAPILAKYCVGCHNDSDTEGELSLESFASIQNGGEHGPAIMPGSSGSSRLIRMLTGAAEPKMPPEDEPVPSSEEIEILKEWIAGGASGPDGQETQIRKLVTPKLAPSSKKGPVTAAAYSPDGQILAVARFRTIELRSVADDKVITNLDEHIGKVNSLAFAANGDLIAATGITGLRSEIVIWNTQSLEAVRRIAAHRDIIYSAIPSPDGKLIASAGYDRDIIIWNRETGERLREFQGHNGAIFDLAFTPDSKILASASADATVKIWDVQTGQRLDTLSQPLKEQYSVVISPDGKFVFACGEDNRIRKWSLVSTDQPRINPMVIARFGHEQSVEQMRLSRDGSLAITSSADGKVKVWDADTLSELKAFAGQPDSVQAIAIHPNGQTAMLGRMDGSLESISVADVGRVPTTSVVQVVSAPNSPQLKTPPGCEPQNYTDAEPNNEPSTAQEVTIPAVISGDIYNAESSADADLFRFAAKAGEEWIVELTADGKESPLDGHLCVLHEDGSPVLRTLLQAVRDSYFTFRGKDSNGTGDFRLHNWREMQLDQYLYASGEVVKLYHYPRGPDSGFNVYPNFGQRFGYFDTTPIAHALGEPCYIVEPRMPDETITPNGLPVFPVYFENDDASDRSLGSNARLTFVAPIDGTYIVAAEDVRGFHGSEFKYKLKIRRPKPDFKLTVSTNDPKVAAGSGKKIDLKLERIDGFSGTVQVDFEDLPEGFEVSVPVTFERDHLRAWTTLVAAEDATNPGDDVAGSSRIKATAMINGEEITKDAGALGKIQLGDQPKVRVSLTATANSPTILEIEPGTTVSAELKIERCDHDGRVSFGSEEALVNTPHGIYVDNIGLNGVLIPEGQTERTIFITAEPWVQPTERWVFIEAALGQNPTSHPILLRVIPRRDLAQQADTK